MTGDEAGVSPSPWIVRFASLIRPAGPVMDVACGAGRHSRYLADRGHPVTAIDRDLTRMTDVRGVRAVQADLEDGSPLPFGGGTEVFSGVIITNYLWRPLFPALLSALEAGGVLLIETFAHGNEAFGRPRNPEFLLGRGELLHLTAGLSVVAYEDGIVERGGECRVMQRICAVNGSLPVRLPE